ncbi:cysteine protease XCP2-like [Homalodisca vitripennis]|uniref:cysteine protease XCP2-like n=1 Tax=Homalodisca vitripennis TaxID=197043 RepID=UPI001EECA3D8|nr:cysteine protease XCP2-like [Homalodisca vitripennis]
MDPKIKNTPKDFVFIYFQNFIKNFRKTYSSIEEYKMRFQIFRDTYDTVQEANAMYPDAKPPPFMINTFADRKRDELVNYYDGFIYED